MTACGDIALYKAGLPISRFGCFATVRASKSRSVNLSVRSACCFPLECASIAA